MADRSGKLIAPLHAAFLLLFSLAPNLLAQEVDGNGQPTQPETRMKVQSDEVQLTLEQIDTLSKQAETSTDLTDEQKKTVSANYATAASELKRAEQLVNLTKESSNAVKTAKADAQRLRAEIDAIDVQPADTLGRSKSVQELQSEVLTRTQQIQQEKKRLLEYETQAGQYATRRKTLTDARASLKDRIAEAQKAMQAAPPEGEDPILSTARRTLAIARFKSLEVEGPAIAAELGRIEIDESSKLTAQRIELQQKKITKLENAVKVLTSMQNKARAEEAARIEQQERQQGQNADPEIQDWLKENSQLARSLIPEATKKLQERTKDLDEVQTDQKRMKDRAEQLGMVVTVGMEFQEQLEELPSMTTVKADIAARAIELANRTATRLKYDERLEELNKELLALPASESNERLKGKTEILNTLLENERAYIQLLRNIDQKERLYVKETAEFEAYLRRRILWIRSDNVLSFEDLINSGQAISWLAAPSRWEEVPAAIVNDCGENILLYVFMAVLFFALANAQSRCRKELRVVGKDASSVSCSRFTPTMRALWLTVLISMMWPGLIGFVGYRLADRSLNSSFVQAVGYGLQVAAIVLMLFNLLRHTCRDEGLGEAHFAWDDEAVRRARNQLRSLLTIILPLLFLVAVFHSKRNVPGGDSLERICYICALLTVAAYVFRIMRPKDGVFAHALAEDRGGWANQTRWLWFPVSFGLPLVLAVLAAMGHYFTAHELSWRLAGMVWMFVSLVIAQALLVRWYAMNRRRARLRQARERQQAMLKEDANAEAKVAEAAANLDQISRQTERMINTGLALVGIVGTWLIWSQVLPAVGFLDEWTLWKTAQEITVEREVDGAAQFETETVLRRITPLSILAAMFIAMVTVTAARNLPGAIEVMLLRHLPLEPALRYALRTVARYIIVIVGTTLTFSTLGIGWSKVQWLVAGLTVGLGFGLQEIFANFVSGLIILFERPVRIGDIVTIDGVSGTVSRIQIRATTITDWDYKEYIVPNKELVTGRLMNWTLTDTMNRIVINVGVAYGSDTNLARSLLTEVASNHPLIMEEPAPLATFEGFGDSTLNLILRCYLPNFDNRLGTISELHDAIDKAFGEANIEIAFPQLDVNVRGELGRAQQG